MIYFFLKKNNVSVHSNFLEPSSWFLLITLLIVFVVTWRSLNAVKFILKYQWWWVMWWFGVGKGKTQWVKWECLHSKTNWALNNHCPRAAVTMRSSECRLHKCTCGNGVHHVSHFIIIFQMYAKLTGVNEALKSEFLNKILKINEQHDEKLYDLLKTSQFPLKPKEALHVELIMQMDSQVILCQYYNQTTFHELINCK